MNINPKKGHPKGTMTKHFLFLGEKQNFSLLCCRVPNLPKRLMKGQTMAFFLFKIEKELWVHSLPH
jgi:hypothetical protein